MTSICATGIALLLAQRGMGFLFTPSSVQYPMLYLSVAPNPQDWEGCWGLPDCGESKRTILCEQHNISSSLGISMSSNSKKKSFKYWPLDLFFYRNLSAHVDRSLLRVSFMLTSWISSI